MNTEELRTAALQKLEAGKALIKTSPTDAVYIAGYALEFMLKARYCHKRGWDRFPDSPVELREWNRRDGVVDKVWTHKVDELLEFSDAIKIQKSSYLNIDWQVACDWDSEMRYKPNLIDASEAEKRIEQIGLVVHELLLFEALQGLLKVEISLTNTFGLFNCFALVLLNDTWTVMMAWRQMDGEATGEREASYWDEVQKLSPPDLWPLLKNVAVIDIDDPWINSARSVFRMMGGMPAHSPRVILRDIVIIGPDIATFPNGFYITLGSWSAETLNQVWIECARYTGNPYLQHPTTQQ